ncbi:family 2 glycosyl transferase [Solibacillus silvestris]|nr:family 2 glycosyl transferase [Solibacillus silvestris]
MNPGISLIIPIYNVENYIKACLTTVLNSIGNHPHIQVLLINDGSNDKSGEIAQNFANTYEQFYYFEKENGGLSDARNYGLQFAEYDYVAFLDSDDLIEENYFSVLLNQIKLNPDLIIFDIRVFDKHREYTLNGLEIPANLWTVQPNAVSKVYKRKLFDNILFPKGIIYEDVGTTYKLLYYIKHFIYIKEPLYRYRENRKGSIMSTISPKINDIYTALEDTYKFYKQENALTANNLEGLGYQYIKLLMWSNMYRQLKFYKFNYLSFYKKMRNTKSLIDLRFGTWSTNSIIHENKAFFKSRFGENYIKKIDYLGKDFLGTLYVLWILIMRNSYKIRSKA